MKRRFVIAVLAGWGLLASAQPKAYNAIGAANPFIPGYFADPTIRKFGDTYYLYATTDGTGNGYGPAQVWVSKDFQNWKNIVMNWPTTEVVWAPDVVQQPDGTFRYYYCEPCAVSIGESTSPIGPWKNILGKDDAVMVPDRYVHNVITLDPQLFRDEDGSEYLYFTTWGIYKGFGCGVAKLETSGTSPVPSCRRGDGDGRFWREDAPFPIAADSFFSEKRLIPNTELKDIFEAPYVFKRNGIYYFTYSSGSCHDHTYRVQYATSTVGPMGPFEYKGCILETNDDQTVHGPGHHSIIEEAGKYYIVYHRHNLPRSVHGFNRQVCIDEMKFDANGNILPVVPTHDAKGVDLFKTQSSRNLALNAKVTASSYYDEWFRPEYAVDDNNATLWKAAKCNWDSKERHDEWLLIDLGRKQKFTEVWTQFEYATFFYQYKIETSVDGKRWTLYADRTDNTMQGSPMIDKGSVKARYVRITITNTQKNGHMPAIWNVKVWQEAPELPYAGVEPSTGYPGMHQKDVADSERLSSVVAIAAEETANGASQPFDVTEVVAVGPDRQPTMKFKANKPIRVRVKDGEWGFFLNGTQRLVSDRPLPEAYRYNGPYTIVAWVLSTKVGPVSTVVSLSSSHADLGTTEFRLGTDPQTGLLNHNGSFESCGVPETVKDGEGKWQLWVVTYDGWKERVYCDGKLVHEQNNFLMIRPDGHITIGADGSEANNFMGYIGALAIAPMSVSADDVEALNNSIDRNKPLLSLGDDDFEEIDPDSKFSLPATMKSTFERKEEQTLSAGTADFNTDPLANGGVIYKEVEGDFVVMARVTDMERLAERSITAYNEGGLLVMETPSPLHEETPPSLPCRGGNSPFHEETPPSLPCRGGDSPFHEETPPSLPCRGGDSPLHEETPPSLPCRGGNSPLLQEGTGEVVYQLGVFPLYNCGNMLTILRSKETGDGSQGRPQFPNYKGYDFDPILQFERRGNLLFARTSSDGLTWTNMPGSPIEVNTPKLSIGAYQTTYSDNPSWVKLSDYIIYQ